MQLSAIFAVLLFTLSLGKIYEQVNDLPTPLTYDYVVVGGGTAGLVVANRLSASGSFKVLVLEAGGSDYGHEDLEIPLLALSIPAATNAAFDWNYTTIRQADCNHRAIPYPRGYVLGGCSSTNYMVYNRGTLDDWNYYAAATQDQGWSWDSMSPFFAKTENFIPSNPSSEDAAGYMPSAHFSNGAVDVSLPSYFWPSDQRVLETTQQLAEFQYQEDYNAGTTLGVGWLQATIGNGTRASASTSYIYPVINSRPNLNILLHARATQVVQTGTRDSQPIFRAVKFVFQPTGQTYTATATREVILSAGVFNTPQLLMLSGIGAPSELEAANKSTIVALPSVGKNMSDHALLINVFTTTSNDTWANYTNPTVLQQQKSLWETTRQGPLSDPPANTVGWMRLSRDDAVMQEHGDPSTGLNSAHWEFLVSEGFVPGLLDSSLVSPGPALTISTVLLSPTSRGTVGLNNADPLAAPILDPNWLHTDLDMHIMRIAVSAIERFIDAPAWQGFNLTPYGPFNGVSRGSGLDAYIRNNSETLWHACGTAAMSPFGASYGVTNPDLTVKGTSGLRVVDASALPRVPSGHPQGVIYAMAERAASLILAASGSH